MRDWLPEQPHDARCPVCNWLLARVHCLAPDAALEIKCRKCKQLVELTGTEDGTPATRVVQATERN